MSCHHRYHHYSLQSSIINFIDVITIEIHNLSSAGEPPQSPVIDSGTPAHSTSVSQSHQRL